MRLGSARVPFTERGGRLRGALDVLSGRYPAFVFGGRTGHYLPVFHFHEVTPAVLEPRLTYLAENGYTTVGSDEIAALVRHGRRPGPRAVALAFDDAHASFWTVAAPLLKRYGFRAILYAIPARIEEAESVRRTLDEDPAAGRESPAGPRFVTWPELRALHASGVADVQSHTWSHSMVYTEPRLVDVVGPGYGATLHLNRPLVSDDGPEWADPAVLGTPIYAHRSRMSDGLRFHPDAAAIARCRTLVRDRGGAAFFARPGWEREFRAAAGTAGRMETSDDRERSILAELARSREELNARLRTDTVRHVCLPWGVAGEVAIGALRRTGYVTAFANRLPGSFAVSEGDEPYHLKRLSNRFIFHLPGRGRTLVDGWTAR